MVEDLHAAVETALAKIAERAEHSALPGLELFSALLKLPGKLVRVSEAQEVPEEFARGGIAAGLYRLLHVFGHLGRQRDIHDVAHSK